MALKVKSWRKHLSTIIWGVIGLVLGACLLRVYIWEQHYYAEKEGSTRATANNRVNQSEVDETIVTEADKDEHVVEADKPRYLTIPKLGVYNARVIEISTLVTGELDTPSNIFDVGWYTGSSKVGTGGTAIFDGHNGGPHYDGVFKHLPDLENGDIIMVERGDGTRYNYQVVDNISIPLEEANNKMYLATRSPDKGVESISLISCTGEWSDYRYTYLSRQFVRAILVQ